MSSPARRSPASPTFPEAPKESAVVRVSSYLPSILNLCHQRSNELNSLSSLPLPLSHSSYPSSSSIGATALFDFINIRNPAHTQTLSLGASESFYTNWSSSHSHMHTSNHHLVDQMPKGINRGRRNRGIGAPNRRKWWRWKLQMPLSWDNGSWWAWPLWQRCWDCCCCILGIW